MGVDLPESFPVIGPSTGVETAVGAPLLPPFRVDEPVEVVARGVVGGVFLVGGGGGGAVVEEPDWPNNWHIRSVIMLTLLRRCMTGVGVEEVDDGLWLSRTC